MVISLGSIGMGGLGLGYVLGLAPSMLGDSRDSPGQLGGDDRNAQYIPLE